VELKGVLMNLSIQNLKIFNIVKQKTGLKTTKDWSSDFCSPVQLFLALRQRQTSWSQPLEVKDQDWTRLSNCQTPIKIAILISLICGLCRYIEVV